MLSGTTNRVDPDQTALQQQSDQGRHCLHMLFCLTAPLIYEILGQLPHCIAFSFRIQWVFFVFVFFILSYFILNFARLWTRLSVCLPGSVVPNSCIAAS